MSDMLIDTPRQPWTADVLTNEYDRQYSSNNEYDYANDNFNNTRNDFISSPKATAANHCYSRQNSNTATNTTAGIADSTNKTDDADAREENEEENDEFANLLSLKLRKPKHWRWELSTSRSCANIALPRILLYDHKGQLLVDVNSQEEQCYSQPQAEYVQNKQKEQTKAGTTTAAQPRPRKRSSIKAATTNLADSIKKALERQLSDLQIQEATPSPVASKGRSIATTPTTEHTPLSPLSPAIDFYTDQLPDDDYKLRRRANSLKGVRFKVNDELKVNTDIAAANAAADNNNTTSNYSFNLADLPTPPSTITTTTTVTPTNSSSSGPRAKRRYRRSHSSGRSPATSESILERFSFNKGRFSSPEFAEEHDVYRPPRYFLRTSKAGTLLVAEESFSRYRRRRRPRNSSNEWIRSGSSKCSVNKSDSGKRRELQSGSLNGLAEAKLSGDSLRYGTDDRQENVERKKILPVRRHRSDGNVLLLHQRTLSTDEDPESVLEQVRALEVEKMKRAQRRRSSHSRKERKSDLIIIDPENDVQHGVDCSESR